MVCSRLVIHTAERRCELSLRVLFVWGNGSVHCIGAIWWKAIASRGVSD